MSFTSARERVNVRLCLCQYVKTAAEPSVSETMTKAPREGRAASGHDVSFLSHRDNSE